MAASSVEINTELARLLNTGQGVETLVLGAAGVTYDVMIKNVSDTSGSGKAYKRSGGIGYHIASAPGKSPVVDSGALKNSISVSRGRSRSNPDNSSDIVIDSPYALDLEFGTSRMRSRPFIIKSIDEAFRTRLKEIIDEFISNINNNPYLVTAMLREYRQRYLMKPRISQKAKSSWSKRRGLTS